ncbi:MAG: hypothetical protein K2Q25_14535 [Mycobacteriaceae bacterium]|nr:hypothetical protein [Mycobacteriaceae bacterium]
MNASETYHKRIRSARRGYLDVIAGVKANIVSGTAAVGAPTLSACVAPGFSALSGGLSGAVGRLDVAGVVNGSADRPSDVPYAYSRTSAEVRERRLSSPIPQRATRATHDHSKPDAATKDMDVADIAARAVDAEEAGDAPAAVCAPTPVPTLAHRMGMA